MKMHEVTAGQVAGAADTVRDTAGLAQLGAMGAGKIASKLAPAANIGGKFAKFIPGLGLVASGADAVRRASAGDWAGAGLSAASGVAGLVPGVGTAASLGLTGLQALRDKQRTGSYLPDTDEIAKASGKGTADGFGASADGGAPTAQAGGASAAAGAQPTAQAGASRGDPKVYALQQQLIAKGAKITADGIMGPQTQTAMKQFGMAEGLKERKMSQREHMKSLMEKLQCIEESPQLMETIKTNFSLSIVFESMASSMGYKAAKDQLLIDQKEILSILEGFNQLPKREQKFIAGMFEYAQSKEVDEMNIGNFRGMGGVGNQLPNIMNTGTLGQAARTLGQQTVGGTKGPNSVASTTGLFDRNAAYKAAQDAKKARSTVPAAGAPAAGAPAAAAGAPVAATRAAAGAPAAGAPAAAAGGATSMMDKLKGFGSKGLDMAKKGASWIAKNPGKAALGTAALGGLAYGGKMLYDKLTGQPVPAPAPAPGAAVKPAAGAAAKPAAAKPAAAKPAAGGLTPEELAELDSIAQEWGDVNDPTVVSLLGAYGQIRQGLAAPKGPAPIPSPVANQPGVAPGGDRGTRGGA